MQREGYQVTADFETTYWWFVSRRELILKQVEKAATALGWPERKLALLDFGCGTGFNLPYFAQFGQVHGADVADESLTEFQKTQEYPLINLRKDTKAYYGRFDIVTALDVIEHIEDDVEGLRGLASYLKPGGQVVLTVPAYQWLWSGEDVISQHKRRYTEPQLLRACRAAGYEVLYSSYFNFSVLPAITAAIWGKRLFVPNGAAQHSDLQPLPRWLNGLLYRMTSAEARWVGEERWRMPAGASIISRLKPITNKSTRE